MFQAIRCTAVSCSCDCFSPCKTQIRVCDGCGHGWVSHGKWPMQLFIHVMLCVFLRYGTKLYKSRSLVNHALLFIKKKFKCNFLQKHWLKVLKNCNNNTFLYAQFMWIEKHRGPLNLGSPMPGLACIIKKLKSKPWVNSY